MPAGQDLVGLGDGGADGFDGIDCIGADPLLDLQRHDAAAVDPGVSRRVLEGAAHAGDVAQAHDAVALGADRQVQQVVGLVEQARHLDGEVAAPGVERAGRHQPVVAGDGLEQLDLGDAVALQAHQIDDDLQQLLPLAGDVDLQHPGQALDLLLQIPGDGEQRAFWQLPRQRHRQHGKEGDVDLVHRRLVAVLGQLGLGLVDLFADVDQGLVGIEAGLELQHDGGHGPPRY